MKLARLCAVRQPSVGGAALAVAIAVSTARGQSTRDSTLFAPLDTTVRRIEATLSPGRVFERLVSRADTGQRYALYLPSAYATDRRWPVLFLLDPRGRALVPMVWLQGAADRFGYVVMSSYNTLSDGPSEPNYAAMDAMLEDVQRHLSVDSRRFYLVGFSGTARFAWDMSLRLPGTVAGIVGAGAATPGGRGWARSHLGSSSPVLFGAIGLVDPNYEEVRAFDADLDSTRTPHHVERFVGAHEWPPRYLADRALAFFDLQAMRRGLKACDQRWIDSVYADWVASGERLATIGDRPAAVRQLRLVQSDFDGLTDVTTLALQIDTLARAPDVRRAAQLEAEAADRDRALAAALFAFVAEVKQANSPPRLDDARRKLDLANLQRAASRQNEIPGSIVAARALARIFMHSAFYLPRELFASRRFAHAALSLAIARTIKPTDGGACFWHARALAQLGEKANAMEALECAAASKQVPLSAIETDPLLEPLRSDPRYDAAVRQLKRPSGLSRSGATRSPHGAGVEYQIRHGYPVPGSSVPPVPLGPNGRWRGRSSPKHRAPPRRSHSDPRDEDRHRPRPDHRAHSRPGRRHRRRHVGLHPARGGAGGRANIRPRQDARQHCARQPRRPRSGPRRPVRRGREGQPPER
jgi:predicted esterase